MYLNIKWQKRFMRLAQTIATWSKDTSTQVGTVIVDHKKRIVSVGYNGMPPGVNDDVKERHERPAKYFYFEHSERNAVYNTDQSLEGCTAFVTHFPCADCARALIKKGLSYVVVDVDYGLNSEFTRTRKDSAMAAFEMFNESGVIVVEI